jgi:hypothetical protein
MFRPLYGHHQTYHFNRIIKTLRTLLRPQLCLQNYKNFHTKYESFQTWCHFKFCKHNWDPSKVRSVLMTWFKW